MFSTSSSARTGARRRSRLLAACTTGVLAAGVVALGPAGAAHADTAARPHVATSIAPRVTQQPTFVLPKRTRSAYSTNSAALTAPLYDYDNDGYSDLLVQEQDATIAVLSSAKIDSGQKGYTQLGKAGTLYRDIITTGNLTNTYTGTEVLGLTASGRLSMFTTDGLVQGTPLWTGTGWQVYNQIVGVGDINGDGFGDLLARTPSGDLYLYKGTGSDTAPFAARVQVGSGFGSYDQLIGAGDLTGTGHETLVARDLSGTLWMYKLDGTAANPVAPRVQIGTGWSVYNQIIGWGDDKSDAGQILGRTVGGTLYGYSGDGSGNGTLTKRVLMGSGWYSAIISGQGHTALWGKDDLFAQTSGGSLYYYSGYNSGNVSSRYLIDGNWKGARLLTSVSLTDAGEQPLLEIYNGTLYKDYGDGAAISGGWGGYNLVFGPGDLNADGHSDLLARDGSGVLWLLTGKGNDQFYGRVEVGPGWGAYNQITGAGDINGDGRADIVARASTGHLYLYLGTGNSKAPFASRVDIGGGWNTYTKLAAPGDLDGDGRADIVAVTSGGQLYRYSATGHTGSTTFKSRVEIGTAGWNAYSSLF
ncbi:FG-GAP-like repeat-containing protein [Streptomyces sp. HPF1205]|uniref:FG-GAP-like repeat-containing protein n=1 Tax=Streptomyces sp. HPF1205 TaxID=2873262 RepID=UPI001CEC2AB2|nr:FG-GAP-like repeat-containing protein [Streptomyces sp. HPF1205]